MKGWYPVMYAVKEGHAELLRECFREVDYAFTTKVYHCIVALRDCASMLVFLCVQNKQTVLHIAARAKHLNCLKEIMPVVTEDIKMATDKV